MLITLEEVKDYLCIKSDYADAKLTDILAAEYANVENAIGQTLDQASVTEVHDGNRTNTVLLENSLVTAITSVKLDRNDDGTYEYTVPSSDYVFYANGMVMLRSGYFAKGLQNIQVIYTHGYENADAFKAQAPDLRMAILKMVANNFHGSITAVEKEGNAKVFTQTEINRVLDKYTRLPV